MQKPKDNDRDKGTPVFRRAACKMTIGGITESFYFLEVTAGGFIGTNRLAETVAECHKLQIDAGWSFASIDGGIRQITFNERYLRQTADAGTLEILPPLLESCPWHGGALNDGTCPDCGDSVRYISSAQLAERYGVNRSTIWRWHRRGVIPPPINISRSCTRWKLETIEAYDRAREGGR